MVAAQPSVAQLPKQQCAQLKNSSSWSDPDWQARAASPTRSTPPHLPPKPAGSCLHHAATRCGKLLVLLLLLLLLEAWWMKLWLKQDSALYRTPDRKP